jgi:hypothetical protein
MSLREGNLKDSERILDYLKIFQKERFIVYTTYLNHFNYHIDDHNNWKDFFPDAEEEIPNDLLKSKGPKVRMTVYVDVDHAHNLVTWIYATDIHLMLSNTPSRWISKYQKTVETSTYVPKLVVSKLLQNSYLKLDSY